MFFLNNHRTAESKENAMLTGKGLRPVKVNAMLTGKGLRPVKVNAMLTGKGLRPVKVFNGSQLTSCEKNKNTECQSEHNKGMRPG